MDQHRIPRGVHGGGQFAAGARGRAPVNLSDTPSGSDDQLPPLEDVLTAEGDRLWLFVRHPNPTVRAECAANPHLTEEQRIELANPTTQPSEVRCAVARLPNPGVASRACNDPDPVVRWLAHLNGWDLTPTERQILDGDAGVARVNAVMADRLAPSL